MISVIVSTHNSEADLAHTLGALVTAAADGAVKEVIIADAGSEDASHQVADAAGCIWVTGPESRGERWRLGARHARRGEWLLFLPPNAILETGWHHEAQSFIERSERSGAGTYLAAAFKLRFDAYGFGPRLAEALAIIRSQLLGMPYGNQGLLISRRFYEDLGGHRPLPEMEDIDLAKRIGRSRLVILRAAAVCTETPGSDGVVKSFRKSIARFCVGTLRIPPSLVLKIHG
ncbi:GT2 family glycosyltransferase [Roseibium hamelinense]|uniref:GT2 family glycosyltransferase n=1 Tax=Roseibium hamelinense TaxID=150831 RepID=A0A562T3V3_9HYPH|nr:glycosyltransferase [Roseibium hamelinense]MTI42199.1 glycosyltransferase [Roseibium hamelinense]TWI87660.1 GT2 family glycosyltransferase [Roseibium hamelinense]